MGVEIERKFLVKNETWRSNVVESYFIRQGYLNSDPERTVRIRIKNEKGILTIKGKNDNFTRKEFEYEIPYTEACQLIELCQKPIIEKTRYLYYFRGLTWEIDVFDGDNSGLIIAEVELDNENQVIDLPDWVGEEVSSDIRYYNSSLINHPYCEW